jgi:hypothetical protein
MAFNPFTSFRKYQKFWMATILLLCMITFVLCTGVGGDLSDVLIRTFIGRRGDAVAKLNGANVHRKELEDLRTRRNIADLFMRNATRLCLKRIEDVMKDKQKIPEAKRQETLLQYGAVQADLTVRLQTPRYFEGGVKLDNLLDFMLWLRQADRLGINLNSDAIDLLVQQALHGRITGFDRFASRQVEFEVRNSNYQATGDFIYRALRDEFRVQIAQLALMGARPDLIFSPPGTLRIRPVSFDLQNRAAEVQIGQTGAPSERYNDQSNFQIRKPVTPEQIWKDYEKNRAEFNVALVPLPVDDFLKEIPAPTEDQLKDFYLKYRDADFNPTTEEPSFKFPPRMKVQWVSADPEAPFYHRLSHAVTTLERTPAVAWTPLLPAPLAALRYAAQSAAWDASLQVNYNHLKMQYANFGRYRGPSLTDPNFALFLATRRDNDKMQPATVAALVGAASRPKLLAPATVGDVFAAPVAYQADVWLRHEKELAPVLAAEAKRRWPLGASMVLSGAASRLLPAAQWLGAAAEPEYLPLALVQDELRKNIEVNLAHRWVVANMLDVKSKLNLPGTAGNERAVNMRLKDLAKRYGLEDKTTEHFHNRYDIDKAPSLEPLLKAFEKSRGDVNKIEGRGGTAEMLKEDDFWRLFFDSSITHSVENAGPFAARPWPPYVKVKPGPFADASAALGESQTIPLFEYAQRPFLFWQTKFEPARAPESLAEVRDKVEHAWKHMEAREKKVLPRAREVAQALQRAGKDLQTVLREEAAKLGHEVITLSGVAPLIPDPKMPGKYLPYELPRNTFLYPQGDMVKQLLIMNELSRDSKAGIKTGNKQLDQLNEELLKRKLEGKQVQVLTNKPRSHYYVAVVTHAQPPSRLQFVMTYQNAAGQFRAHDEFVASFQANAGIEYRRALTKQLRDAAEVSITSGAQAGFDGSSGGG